MPQRGWTCNVCLTPSQSPHTHTTHTQTETDIQLQEYFFHTCKVYCDRNKIH